MRTALVGNPNSGKSSLYNHLTGLRQKTGNYPGITVDKKIGKIDGEQEIIDLPGLYDIIPSSPDEQVVLTELFASIDPIDKIVYVLDASQLETGLILFTQIADLGKPMILAINMIDQARQNGISINLEKLSLRLGLKIYSTNARTGEGVNELKTAIIENKFELANAFCRSNYTNLNDPLKNGYQEWISKQVGKLNLFAESTSMDGVHEKIQGDLIQRQRLIDVILKETSFKPAILKQTVRTLKIDRILTHPIFGYGIFLMILLLIFQAIFSWSAGPSDFIDVLFGSTSVWISDNWEPTIFTKLLAEGIIPGIGGIVVFIPQIALLFFFITLLEGSGYMSRVVFLMDRIMKKFGLNGRSVVPLMSGIACAIPAIMAARTIENRKERLITILVTPFMTCAARLPVYVIIIALIIPESATYLGFDGRALALLSLYLLGVMAVLVSAIIINGFMKSEPAENLIMEMPVYRVPYWKDVLLTILDKVKAFVWGAGKIIFVISIVLWFAASFGPKTSVVNGNETTNLLTQNIDLEESYAGLAGKVIEPVIAPLGYDWKIGIALISSFAAREVFVATLATIYSIGEDAENETIIARMRNEVVASTGQPRFNLATSISLLLFYAFAMQCISTIAIVKRETKTWKWPIVQFIGMTGLAYIASFVAYQMLT